MNREYGLTEKFAIVASDIRAHRKHTFNRTNLEVYVIGAALIELMLNERVLVDAKGYLRIEDHAVDNTDPNFIPLVDSLLNARKPRKLKGWIHYFYMRYRLRQTMMGSLTKSLFDEGAMAMEKRKFLYIIPYHRYVTTPEHKDPVIQRLRAELLEDGPVTKETAILAMMMETSQQLKVYFSGYEKSELKRKLSELHETQHEEWKNIKLIRRALEEIEASST
ncbi:GPP34 family phosphoprotein [Paenibacillus sp. CF384]|uniref:GOLPH3/VPS74 family protein n=1 Tax=Paenibacillus sp. CF384 TaxID=1884382 RepID=UPI00089D4083|nr:GPP34 family phosphoprotein [Paenibacillus sp. CF384]SDX16204.1 Golgi phosphoprotein 3 (GPP34) [Paenibacillus sp. CF384]